MLEAAILKCRLAAGVGIPVDKHVIDHEDIEVGNFLQLWQVSFIQTSGISK